MPAPDWVPPADAVRHLGALLAAVHARLAARGVTPDMIAALAGASDATVRQALTGAGHVRVRPGLVAALLVAAGADVPATADPLGSCLCDRLANAGEPALAEHARAVETGVSEHDIYLTLSAEACTLTPEQTLTALLAGSLRHGPFHPEPAVGDGVATLWRRTIRPAGLVLPPDWLVAAPGATLADLAATLDLPGRHAPWQWIVYADGYGMHPLSAVPDGILRGSVLDLIAGANTKGASHIGPRADSAHVAATAAIGHGETAAVLDASTGQRVALYTLVGDLDAEVAAADHVLAALDHADLAPRVWASSGPAIESLSESRART